jgi:hypothetical protein
VRIEWDDTVWTRPRKPVPSLPKFLCTCGEAMMFTVPVPCAARSPTTNAAVTSKHRARHDGAALPTHPTRVAAFGNIRC